MDWEISPELAAVFVENYLLPMFESDYRVSVTKRR